MTACMSPAGIDHDILRRERGVEPLRPGPSVQPYRHLNGKPKVHVVDVTCIRIFLELIYFSVSGGT